MDACSQTMNWFGERRWHQRLVHLGKKMRVEGAVVRFNEHGFGKSEEIGIAREKSPIVTHERITWRPYQLRHSAGLARAAPGRHQNSMPLVIHGHGVQRRLVSNQAALFLVFAAKIIAIKITAFSPGWCAHGLETLLPLLKPRPQ